MRKFVPGFALLALSPALLTGCPRRDHGAAPAVSASAAPTAASKEAPLPPGQHRWQSLASKRRLPLLDKNRGASEIHTVGGDRLLVYEANGWSVFPLGAEKPSARLAAPTDSQVTENVAGSFLVRGEPQAGITAYDATTLTKAWTFATPKPHVERAHVLDDGATLVVFAGKDSYADEVIALDAKTGTKKWSAPMYPSTAHHTYVGGNVVVFAKPDGTTAVDGSTGKELWKRPHSGENGEYFVYVGTDWIVARYGQVIDGHTGKDAPKIEDLPDVDDIRAVPDGRRSVVVALDTHLDGGVYALDLAQSKILWRATLPRHDTSIPTGRMTPSEIGRRNMMSALFSIDGQRSYPYSFAADDDAVFATRGDGVLHAFDVHDGKERWTWSLLGGQFAIVHGPPFTLYSIQDGVVEAFEEGSVPVEHAKISGVVTEKGRPAPGKEVWIGSTKVVSDDAGKFTGTFDGRGNVRVIVHAHAPTPPNPPGLSGLHQATFCFLDGEQLVRLEGKGTYDVKLPGDLDCHTSDFAGR